MDTEKRQGRDEERRTESGIEVKPVYGPTDFDVSDYHEKLGDPGEGTHHATEADHQTLVRLDHDLQVLWDLRRRELAGEAVSIDEDYYDSYTRYTD